MNNTYIGSIRLNQAISYELWPDLLQTNSSLNESKEKLQKSLEDVKSKDEEIASLKQELSSKASLGDKESELQKVRVNKRDYIDCVIYIHYIQLYHNACR